jgi:predicted component of type VI protein secretion system
LVVVGRRSYCDIVIEHSSLSKRHCVLVKTDGLLVIRDLLSTNGTKVKGQRIRWAALLPDDRISLGTYKMRVYLGPDDAPGPSELFRTRAARVALTGKPAAAPAPARKAAESFPEPSPMEISVAASDGDMAAVPRRPAHHDEPLIPIVLDDDDEIIDLD